MGEQLIVDTFDRDKYFVSCRVRECEGINKGWDKPAKPAPALPSTRLLALARTLANMITPFDGLLNRDSMHCDMVLAERSDETLCSDADALYRVIEEARTILDAM